MANFISRELYQNTLPKFYDEEVSEILTNLDNSLDALSEKEVVQNEYIQSHNNHYPKKSHYRPVTQHISLGNSYNIVSMAPTTVYARSDHRNKKAEAKKESGIPVLLIVSVSVIIIGACSYFAGKSQGKINGNSQDIEDLQKLNQFIDGTERQIKELETKPLYCKNLPALHHQLNKMKVIASSREIFAQIKSDAKWDRNLRITLAVGAAILAVGACLAAKPLMLAGAGVMFFTACAMLVTAGLKSDPKQLNTKIKKIRAEIQTIQNVLAKVKNKVGESVAKIAEFRLDEEALHEMNNPVYFSAPSWEEDLPQNASEEERNSLRNEYLQASPQQMYVQQQFQAQPQAYYQEVYYQQPQVVYNQPWQQPQFNQFQPQYANYVQI